jgi:hypothetical protein
VAKLQINKSFSTEFAHCVNSTFTLHALAAHKLLQAHYSPCRNAATRPAIHAHCCEDQSIKDRVVDWYALGVAFSLSGLKKLKDKDFILSI